MQNTNREEPSSNFRRCLSKLRQTSGNHVPCKLITLPPEPILETKLPQIRGNHIPCNLLALPPELLLEVASYLPEIHDVAYMRTNRWLYSVLTHLLCKFAATQALPPPGKHDLLCIAAWFGYYALAQCILSYGTPIENLDYFSGYNVYGVPRRPLMAAIIRRNVKMIDLLLAHGVKVDIHCLMSSLRARGRLGSTRLAMLRKLTAASTQETIRRVDYHGTTVLMRAVFARDMNVVRFLVEELGMEVDCPADTGRLRGLRPVIAAGVLGYWDVMWYLVEHGASVDNLMESGQKKLWLETLTHIDPCLKSIYHDHTTRVGLNNFYTVCECYSSD
ncbi:ankyrin repeat-containing domain protein [Geopyxis carbonaria]|nr:ankyrin repeat-containing domain protein [Geopyxis carbonaria]